MARYPSRYLGSDFWAWPLSRFLFLVLLLPLSVQGMELSLEEAIHLALRKNPLIAEMEKRVEEALQYEREARSSFLPSLDFAFSKTIKERAAEFELPLVSIPARPATVPLDLTKDYQYSFRLRQNLFTGGKLISNYNQAKLKTRHTRELGREMKAEVIYETKRAFYSAIFAKSLLKLREEALLLAERNLERTKRLVEVGMATKLDLMRSEVHLQNAKAQLIHAKNGLERALLALSQVIGLEGLERAEPTGELLLPPFEPDIERLKDLSLRRRPDLIRLKIEQTIAREGVRLARGLYSPNVAIAAELNLGSDRFTLRGREMEETYTIALVLNIPVFDGFSRAARLTGSRIAEERLKYTLKTQEQKVLFELNEAVLDFITQKDSLEARRRAIDQAQEALRVAELNYEEGLATSLDVLSSQTALTEAKVLHLETLYNYNLALARIEKASGVSLEELH